MISVLTQERLLGAALGGAFVAAAVFEQRRGIYRSISDGGSADKARYEARPIWGKDLSSECAKMWNKAVDGTLGNVVAYLSSRGW